MTTVESSRGDTLPSSEYGPMAAPLFERPSAPRRPAGRATSPHPTLRARQLVSVAVDGHLSLPTAAFDALLDEAADLAASVGDDSLSSLVHATRFGLRHATPPSETLELAASLLDAGVAEETEPLLAHLGLGAALRLGDLRAAESLLDRMDRGDGRTPPIVRWTARRARAALSFARGEIEPARQSGIDAVQLSRGTAFEGTAVDHFGILLLSLLRERGRLADARPTVETWVHEHPTSRLCRALRSWVRAETDDVAGARSDLEIFFADRWSEWEPTQDRRYAVAAAVRAAASMGDGGATWCRAGRDALAPAADQWIVAGDVTSIEGPVVLAMAIASITVGEPRRALQEVAAAQRMARTSGSPLFLAHAIRDRALILRRAGMVEESVDAVAEASARYRSLGLDRQAEEVERSARQAAPVRLAVAASGGPPLLGEFRRDGAHWRVRLGDDAAVLRHRKGLRMIWALIAATGESVSAVDLSAIAEEDAPHRADRNDPTPPPELLDHEAIASFRRRLDQIAHELDRADRRGDVAWSQRLHAEQDSVTAELERARGLGGRPRRMVDEHERARVRVTKAIRLAIEAIGDDAPRLRRHLADSVSTGARCSYEPSVAIDWEL